VEETEMSTLVPVSYKDPLDLLRRCTPTPLKAEINLEIANIVLETNDLSFLPSLSRLSSAEISTKSCFWKIVRDVDVRGTTIEASIVMAGNLIVYSMGPACLIGADRERSEILAFIGRDVDTHSFQEAILPALCRLTEFVTRQREAPIMIRPEVAMGDSCNA
jgi:hypothetical protein